MDMRPERDMGKWGGGQCHVTGLRRALGQVATLADICRLCVLAGRPEEPDDSENSTIYITGLTENATIDDLAEFFKHCGVIRVRDGPSLCDAVLLPGESPPLFYTLIAKKLSMWQNSVDFLRSQMNKRLGQPAINIYTDKDTGKPKGDATLSYEEPPSAKAAVEWFDGKSSPPLPLSHTPGRHPYKAYRETFNN